MAAQEAAGAAPQDVMRHGWLVAAALFAVTGISRADIDVSEYEIKKTIPSEKERSRIRQDVEAQKKAEEERARIQAQTEARERAERAIDRRPYPVRLTEARCTECHTADNYLQNTHTRLGWELVVLRMRWLNGAKLGSGEHSVIVFHLSETRPATGLDAVLEAALMILAVVAPLAVMPACGQAPDTPAVAAAADLQFALTEAAGRFERQTGRSLKLAFGSSGNFARQIEQGAPFELFLSADESYANYLAGRGRTEDRGVLYGVGRVVLFAPEAPPSGRTRNCGI